jgi:hypothetical protein
MSKCTISSLNSIPSNNAISADTNASSSAGGSNNTAALIVSSTSVGQVLFSVGDKVKIAVSLEAFKKMQEGHGGWNCKMADVTHFSILNACFKLIYLILHFAK